MNGKNREAVLAHVAHIASSELFAGAARLCRFLRFTVEAKLDGRDAEVKEYTLGREVFDRGEDYDPRLDPIVRVEARRLRSRLIEYYSGPGRDDVLRLDYPKGSYLPVIREANGAMTRPARRLDTPWIAATAILAVAVVATAFSLVRHTTVPPMIAAIPETWIQANDGTLDAADAALAEDVDVQLASDPRVRVVAWPEIAHDRPASYVELSRLAAMLHATQLLVVLVRDLGSTRRISAFVVEEPQGRKRLALTYYADASLEQFAVQNQYAQRIARDVSAYTR
ncbi:MAG TPA: hypothetical protein VMB20_13915 [Candidatus Acidoferrum sp.]|nr:hypothetical protein [Candidatus Acidoferrum sp.]